MSDNDEELIALTASIVSAYVTRNNVPTADLPRLIASTHIALATLAGPPAPAAADPLVPAVPIRRSVMPDAIICLEDGRAFKSLKRHLSASYGLTPDQYRRKWNLPADYPMVAPNYAEARSALAKSMGLGRKGAASARARAKT
jgi:predicted transcriptional regulator